MKTPKPTPEQIAQARLDAEHVLMGPVTSEMENLAKVLQYLDHRCPELAHERDQKAAQYERQKEINLTLAAENKQLRESLEAIGRLPTYDDWQKQDDDYGDWYDVHSVGEIIRAARPENTEASKTKSEAPGLGLPVREANPEPNAQEDED